MSIANAGGHPAMLPAPTTRFVSPERFWTAFQNVASGFDAQLVASWSDTVAYTKLIRTGVFEALAHQLDLTRHPRDYWTIDAIFYREQHGPPFHERETYAKYIEVAIEHENVAVRSHEEINKLQLISAPLKVLITYPGNHQPDETYLYRYAPIIQAADIFGDISTLRRQLVIFGRKRNRSINWTAHIYFTPGFRPLSESPATSPAAPPA